MTITRLSPVISYDHAYDDGGPRAVMGDDWEGQYVSWYDHVAAMTEAYREGAAMADAYRAGAEAMREACGHAADAVGAGIRDCQYLDGQADAWRAVLDCEIPTPPTNDDGATP